MRKQIIWVIIAALLISQCYALGIAPGHVDITFEAGAVKNIDLKIINNDKKAYSVVLYAEGELAEYITLEQTLIEFKASEKEKSTSYRVELPQKFDKQGLHTGKIVARQVASTSQGTGVAMAASVAVISKVNVMVPYTGKYAEIKLFSPHFEQGKSNNFAIEVKNLGTEKILDGKVIVDVYGPTNEKIKSLTSDVFSLESKDKDVVVIKWMPDLGPGNYKAIATLLYDGLNTKDEKPFSIGESRIDILDISVRDFTLGGIAKFEILLENVWNEDIPSVFGDVTVKDSGGNIYAASRTASVDVGSHEKQTIEAYWDTKNVGAGNYKLGVILNYLGKKTEQVFDIVVSMNEIRTAAIGQVISPAEGESSSVMQGIYVLTFLVVVLIIFNIIIYFKKTRSK